MFKKKQTPKQKKKKTQKTKIKKPQQNKPSVKSSQVSFYGVAFHFTLNVKLYVL